MIPKIAMNMILINMGAVGLHHSVVGWRLIAALRLQ